MEKSILKSNIDEKLDAAVKEEEKSLAGFFIRKFRFTYLIIIAIVMLGSFSLLSLPREANPEVKVPFAVVTAFLPGATPTDMEELVTKEIEDELRNLDGMKQYTSSSGQGLSSIFVEFEANADLQESFRKLRSAVDNAKPSLPAEAEDPVVTEISFSDIPIVTYSLVADLSDVELKRLADALKDEFESIKNVSKVEVLGGLEREFQVTVDQVKLANYGLTLSQIVNAVSRTNFSLPAGNVEIDGFKYNVRFQGKFRSADDLRNIVVATNENTPIYLRDLGEITDGFKEKTSESRIALKGDDANNTISLQIFKRTGGNILDIVDDSREAIGKLEADGTLPEAVTVQKTNDNSVFIREDLSRLGKSGIQTMILIAAILFMVLSVYGAVITAMSVPLAFLISFTVLYLTGETLNSLVLFSLVLSLGLMVDNSIVIVEGISEYISKHKRGVYEASLLSVWNFKWPIISGTLTTVSAFLPILLVSGIMGEFLRVLPITIVATLLSSLFVAIVVIPTLMTRFLKIKPGQNGHRNKRRHRFTQKVVGKFHDFYEPKMRSLLASKKKRRLLIASAWVLFAISIAVPASGLMKIEMFPKVDIDYFVINMKLPVGSVMEKTDAVAREVEGIVAEIPELDNYVTNIGASLSITEMGIGGSGGSHLANITVNLVDKDLRERASYEVAESLREKLDTVQGAVVTAEELSAGPPTGAPVEVRITGDDLAELSELSDTIVKYFKNVPGVINLKDNLQESTGDFTFTIDRERADYYGLSTAAIASVLRSAVFGVSASTVTIGEDDIDITVKYDKAAFKDVESLGEILLPSPRGGTVQLKQVASLDLEPSLLSVSHRDGKRIATVSAGIEAGVNLQEVLAGFDDYKSTLVTSENVEIAVGGETEDIEQSFTELFLSMIIAVILITVILVLQFDSFRQPFIIMFTLPLSLIGVIAGLNLLGLPFSFTAFIGIVALAGIVVNDAIVLIDRINKNLANGMDYIDGIVESGTARIQPIILTSLTTIAGILPLVFADELWRGLAVTVIAGLIFSTMLTLVMVPVMYVGLCRKERAPLAEGQTN